MLCDVVAAAARDALERVLEPGIGERLDLAALAAHEVMVVVAARVGPLEAGSSVAEVDPLDEREPAQRFEGSIHARHADASAAAS